MKMTTLLPTGIKVNSSDFSVFHWAGESMAGINNH